MPTKATSGVRVAMKTVLAVVVGMPCGAVVGFGLAFLAAMGVGLLMKWASPDDPSAGSLAGVAVFLFVPVGLLAGSVLGGMILAERPRLFFMTIFPAALMLVGWRLALGLLGDAHRPRTYVVKLTGTPGAEVVGYTLADGEVHLRRAALPAEFEHRARRLELAFALVDPKPGREATIEVFVDGQSRIVSRPKRAVSWRLASSGYAEWVTKTSIGGGGELSDADVAQLIQGQALPEKPQP